MKKILLSLAFCAVLSAIAAIGLFSLELVARLTVSGASIPQKNFQEHSRVIYKSNEFDVLASTNIFGFRGDEAVIEPGQIAVIGDSFVFGWGVGDEAAWPHVLQSKLRSAEHPMKVYNLGKPGASPIDYLDIARSYIPFLKPKIVIVSLLQGDDFAQLLESAARGDAHGTAPGDASRIEIFLRNRFPGLFALARSASAPAISEAASSWSEITEKFIKPLNMPLPSDIRALVEAGRLNPALIYLASQSPRRLVAAYDSENAARLESRLTEILTEIAALAEKNDGVLMLLSMPYGAYFPSDSRESYSRMGFELPSLEFSKADEFVERLGQKLGLPYSVMSDELRRHADLNEIWFKYDGHLTEKGNAMIADVVLARMTRTASVRSPASDRDLIFTSLKNGTQK